METKERSTTTDDKSENTPAKRIRAGTISATVWANEANHENGSSVYYTVSLDRSYTDKEGKWHHTSTLRAQDLPKTTLVLQKAYEWIMLEAKQ